MNLRVVEWTGKGKGQETNIGHFHKWMTVKSHGYTEEFAIIEDGNGLIHQVNIEDHIIKFLDKDGK